MRPPGQRGLSGGGGADGGKWMEVKNVAIVLSITKKVLNLRAKCVLCAQCARVSVCVGVGKRVEPEMFAVVTRGPNPSADVVQTNAQLM